MVGQYGKFAFLSPIGYLLDQRSSVGRGPSDGSALVLVPPKAASGAIRVVEVQNAGLGIDVRASAVGKVAGVALDLGRAT